MNKCPERVLSAENDKLHTTYYEILSPTLEDKENEPNNLFNVLDQKILCALFDILFWKEGPRLRDKISHGVCDPDKISSELTEITFSIALYLVTLYVPPKLNDSKFIWNDNISNYESFFHPISSLKRNFIKIDSELNDFYNEILIECFKNHHSNNHRILKNFWEKDLLKKVNQYIDFLKLRKVSNLFEPNLFSDSPKNYVKRFLIIEEKIPSKFSGRIGNCIAPEISKIKLVEKIILLSSQFIHKVKKQVKFLENQTTEKEENHYAKLMDNMYSFYLLMILNLNIGMECLYSKELEHKIREQSKNIIESMQNSIITNVWNKLEKMLIELFEMIDERMKKFK